MYSDLYRKHKKIHKTACWTTLLREFQTQQKLNTIGYFVILGEVIVDYLD